MLTIDRHLLSSTPLGKSLINDITITIDDKSVRTRRSLFTDSPILSAQRNLLLERILLTQYTDNLSRTVVKSETPEQILPTRILDAPSIIDDYYLHLLSWSSTGLLAVALSHEVYTWDVTTGETRCLARLKNDQVTSIAWYDGMLAVGSKNGRLDLLDVETRRRISSFKAHSARIGVLAWRDGRRLTSGGRDRNIIHHDIRQPGVCTRVCGAHEQEICGLSWDSMLGKLASGGNDNCVMIWDERADGEVQHRLCEHSAAVKALAWSPHQRGLLVTGGGTADRTIRFWNVQGTDVEHSISSHVTASQVCNAVWSPHETELLTTHGFSEHLCLRWNYPDMRITGTLRGHTQRVLYLAISPDGGTVATASADETVRLWPVFTKQRKMNQRSSILLEMPNFH